jgi:uncharacterized protein YndB with AHSA1/START domain
MRHLIFVMTTAAGLTGCSSQPDAAAAGGAPGSVSAGTHDVVETRTFDAPLERVWSAWTDGDRISQWWGPRGFSVPVADVDFREGGTSLICMRAPEDFGGQLFCNTWTYSKIDKHDRIDFVLHFTDEFGNRFDPADLDGMPNGIPPAVPHEITFRRVNAQRTELTIREYGYTTPEAYEISKAGLDQVLEKLGEHLQAP